MSTYKKILVVGTPTTHEFSSRIHRRPNTVIWTREEAPRKARHEGIPPGVQTIYFVRGGLNRKGRDSLSKRAKGKSPPISTHHISWDECRERLEGEIKTLGVERVMQETATPSREAHVLREEVKRLRAALEKCNARRRAATLMARRARKEKLNILTAIRAEQASAAWPDAASKTESGEKKTEAPKSPARPMSLRELAEELYEAGRLDKDTLMVEAKAHGLSPTTRSVSAIVGNTIRRARWNEDD